MHACMCLCECVRVCVCVCACLVTFCIKAAPTVQIKRHHVGESASCFPMRDTPLNSAGLFLPAAPFIRINYCKESRKKKEKRLSPFCSTLCYCRRVHRKNDLSFAHINQPQTFGLLPMPVLFSGSLCLFSGLTDPTVRAVEVVLVSKIVIVQLASLHACRI